MEETKDETGPFISTDGLAGDATLFRGSIKAREDTISSLEARIAEMDHACNEEKLAPNAALLIANKETKQQMMKKLEYKLEVVERKRERAEYDLHVTCKARKAPLYEQITKLQALNQRESKFIAPIQKLPVELLGWVFKCYVELDQSPWLLAVVSRSWQHTAVTTPVLWTHLRVGTKWWAYSYFGEARGIVDGKERLSYGRRIICRNVDELQLISNRSGSLSLDIQIGAGAYEAIVSMIKVVLQGPSMAGRIAVMAIKFSEFPRETRMRCEELALKPLPNLQCLKLLHLSNAFGLHLLDQVSFSSPHFTGLQVIQRLPLSPNYSIWSSLEWLDLGSARSYERDASITPSAFDELIPSLNRLKRLENPPHLWPNDTTPSETTLSNLTHLNVRCHARYLEKLNLPSLTHLAIEEFKRDEGHQQLPAPSSICFPALTTLEVSHIDPTSWLHVLFAPMMSSITLKGLGPQVMLSSFHGTAFPSVTRVVLEGYCESPDNIIVVLECVPNAKEVALALHRGTSRHLVMFILEKLSEASGDTICPLMTSLTLGNNPAGIEECEAIVKQFAEKVIKRRSESGIVMERFQANWYSKGGAVTTRYA